MKDDEEVVDLAPYLERLERNPEEEALQLLNENIREHTKAVFGGACPLCRASWSFRFENLEFNQPEIPPHDPARLINILRHGNSALVNYHCTNCGHLFSVSTSALAESSNDKLLAVVAAILLFDQNQREKSDE